MLSKRTTICGRIALVSIMLVIFGIHSTLVFAADEAAIKELKEKLIIANKILDMENLARPLGHISVRIPGTDTFLITRSVAPGMATLDDIVVCDLNGKVIEGKYKRTFGEVAAHTGVYKKRKDINSVAHTHSQYVIALSMTGTPILPINIDAIDAAGPEPIAIFQKISFIDSQEVGEAVADLLGPNNAVMIKGHGAVVVGNSLEECAINSVRLEKAAQTQLLAASVGKILPITEEEKRSLYEYLKKAAGRGAKRAFDYYKFLLKK